MSETLEIDVVSRETAYERLEKCEAAVEVEDIAVGLAAAGHHDAQEYAEFIRGTGWVPVFSDEVWDEFGSALVFVSLADLHGPDELIGETGSGGGDGQ